MIARPHRGYRHTAAVGGAFPVAVTTRGVAATSVPDLSLNTMRSFRGNDGDASACVDRSGSIARARIATNTAHPDGSISRQGLANIAGRFSRVSIQRHLTARVLMSSVRAKIRSLICARFSDRHSVFWAHGALSAVRVLLRCVFSLHVLILSPRIVPFGKKSGTTLPLRFLVATVPLSLEWANFVGKRRAAGRCGVRKSLDESHLMTSPGRGSGAETCHQRGTRASVGRTTVCSSSRVRVPPRYEILKQHFFKPTKLPPS